MKVKKAYEINRLRDYSSLFYRNEVLRWNKNDLTSIQLKILRYDARFINTDTTYLSYLKYVYQILTRHYPNEYVYKNEFINKWLLTQLGERKSVVYSEFRLGKAVADMAMFNGTSRVFEIKTLLDQESRLSFQLEHYHKIFNETFVIVPEIKADKYRSIDSSVGIISYDHNEGDFKVVRPAARKVEINVDALMLVLHTSEYIQLVHQYFGNVPSITDFNKFDVCKKLIQQIPQKTLNKLFIELMKARKINNEFSRQAAHLNQIFLSLNLNSINKKSLLSNLQTTITN